MKHRCQRGIPIERGGLSLMEVLVSLLVLGVGLLGVAGLMLRALADLSDATVRSAAVRLATEVVDSVTAAGTVVPGERSFPGGTLRWRLGESPATGAVWVHLEAATASLETVFSGYVLVSVDHPAESILVTGGPR